MVYVETEPFDDDEPILSVCKNCGEDLEECLCKKDGEDNGD